MKFWQGAVIAILVGIIGTALIHRMSAPPRGSPVELIPPPTESPLRVYIDGEIASPGVYEMPSGSRVEDLIETAGGLTVDADSSDLNKAAVLGDAEKIHIPGILPTVQAADKAPTTVETEAGGSPIDINTASQEELESLPGIGPVIAGRIVEFREANGLFEIVEDLQLVEGIGPATFAEIKGLVEVSH